MSFFCNVKSVGGENSYFAAANTKDGFVSYFDDIFAGVGKIYVIKGGPGTGKSTLMNKIAAEGKNRGFEVQKYYCSSDSSSLDGVVVGDKFAVLDGTSPHATEPRCVGAVDEIINLSDMWDTKMLVQSKEEICSITRKISKKYTSVYSMLNSFAKLEEEYFSRLEPHINSEKLEKFTERLAKKAEDFGTVKRVICDSIGTRGYTHIASLESDAKRVIYLNGKYHEGMIFTDYLKNALDKLGASYTVAISPESSQPSGILFGDMAFVCVDDVPCDAKALTTNRFLLPTIKNDRSRLRSLEQICKSLSVLICDELDCIGKLHDELEEYYKRATNYQKLDLFTKKLLIKMFC